MELDAHDAVIAIQNGFVLCVLRQVIGNVRNTALIYHTLTPTAIFLPQLQEPQRQIKPANVPQAPAPQHPQHGPDHAASLGGRKFNKRGGNSSGGFSSSSRKSALCEVASSCDITPLAGAHRVHSARTEARRVVHMHAARVFVWLASTQ